MKRKTKLRTWKWDGIVYALIHQGSKNPCVVCIGYSPTALEQFRQYANSKVVAVRARLSRTIRELPRKRKAGGK